MQMPMYHIMLPTSVDTAPISAFKNIIALAFLFVTKKFMLSVMTSFNFWLMEYCECSLSSTEISFKPNAKPMAISPKKISIS